MNLEGHTRDSLVAYTTAQVGAIVPDGSADRVRRAIDGSLDAALARVETCLGAVAMWKQGSFDPLNSSQYAIYLYYLSHQVWVDTRDPAVPTRLFLLNKALNGIDLFYEIEMPEIFFIGHSVGIVLAKATYGNHLVLYQNSTVGKNHGVAPVLGDGVILYPNTAVIGRSVIGDRSVLSQGTSVVNAEIPADSLVFGRPGHLDVRVAKRRIIDDFFRH